MTDATILLVDDEKTVLDSLKQQLRGTFGRRFNYETAENVDEAWEVIEELERERVPLVVVVSDWLMPGVKGDEFLSAVSERYPLIVRIMLTGQADRAAVERVQAEGRVMRVLAKPWRIEDLQEVIEAGVMR